MIVAWHLMTTHEADPAHPGYLLGYSAFNRILKAGFLVPDEVRLRRSRKLRLGESKWDRMTSVEREKAKYDIRLWYGIPGVRRGGRYEENDIQTLDRVVGDSKYVFLSLIPYHHNMAIMPEVFDRQKDLHTTWGFGFDAEALIDRGAVVGKTDLLTDYEKALRRYAKEFFLGVPPSWGGEQDPWKVATFAREKSPRVILYYLGIHGGMPGFLQEVRKLQAAHRLSGSAAKEYVRGAWEACAKVMEKDPSDTFNEACTFGSPIAEAEIMWPGALSVKWASWMVEEGLVRRTSG